MNSNKDENGTDQNAAEDTKWTMLQLQGISIQKSVKIENNENCTRRYDDSCLFVLLM